MAQASAQQQIPASLRGWTVTLAAVGINLVLGVLYAWSVMGRALVQQWNWTQTQAALPFAVASATFAVVMIFAGRMQDKLGPRYIAMLGGAVLGLGLLASSSARSPVVMVLSFGLLAGAGIGLGYSATTPAAIKWFAPARKGLITGIVVSGVGLAAVYMSPLTQFLLARTTISRTFAVMGVGTIAVACLLSLLLRNPPAGYQPPPSRGAAPRGRPAAGAARRDLEWNQMLCTPQFYLLWLMFVLAASAGLMLIANAASIADSQAGWKAGFVPVMTLAAFNTLGRIAGGYLSDRVGRTRTMVLFFLVQAGNMLVFDHYTTAAWLVFGTALAGLCYGTIFTLMPAAVADFYGVANLGVNYGLLFTAFGVAGALGSLLGGRVRDLLGSYSAAYTALAIMLLAGAVVAFFTSAPGETARAQAAVGAAQ